MTQRIGAGAGAQGNGRWSPPPPGERNAEQIRDDIVRQREDFGRTVDALRVKWGEVTDVKRQVREHRTQLMVGAAVAGFLVGGAIALSRRR